MTTSEPLSGVSRTAIAVARVRARESERPDGLFRDPCAAAFVAASGYPTSGRPGPFALALAHHTVLRTRFYDDSLLAAADSGCRQVVLLAAGLDARAYRLDWPPGLRLHELDLPPVLDFKHHVLAGLDVRPRCIRTPLPVDLLDPGWPDRLTGAGFDPAERTAWLVEGLLMYLTAEQAATLLETVGRLSAPGSRLMVERGRDPSVGADDPSIGHITSLWRGGLGPGLTDWLGDHGWRVTTHPATDLADRYNRPGPTPPSGGFLTATIG
ncbi:SAM-dependent methyltransferase [Streptomyces orinoci]|uniref:S-adenosyl-L-methionine-dependent methyltransferase n=1 Tax=Streptomyces orinoci TaxID=67339 RepID=A0ABV3K841_STRON|nr:SAM-dependent methyltransferase [Streptomyces orinoci]